MYYSCERGFQLTFTVGRGDIWAAAAAAAAWAAACAAATAPAMTELFGRLTFGRLACSSLGNGNGKGKGDAAETAAATTAALGLLIAVFPAELPQP